GGRSEQRATKAKSEPDREQEPDRGEQPEPVRVSDRRRQAPSGICGDGGHVVGPRTSEGAEEKRPAACERDRGQQPAEEPCRPSPSEDDECGSRSEVDKQALAFQNGLGDVA